MNWLKETKYFIALVPVLLLVTLYVLANLLYIEKKVKIIHGESLADEINVADLKSDCNKSSGEYYLKSDDGKAKELDCNNIAISLLLSAKGRVYRKVTIYNMLKRKLLK